MRDPIRDYLEQLRDALRSRRGVDPAAIERIAWEAADHLHAAADAEEAAGASTADAARCAVARFGSAREVARGYARPPRDPDPGGEGPPSVTVERVRDRLRRVKLPFTDRDPVARGMIGQIVCRAGRVEVEVKASGLDAAVRDALERECREQIEDLPGVEEAYVYASRWEPIDVGPVVAVAHADPDDGEVALNLAVALAGTGASVGLLDARMARASGLDAARHPSMGSRRLVPREAYGIKVLSLLFEFPRDPTEYGDSTVFGTIDQLMRLTDWGQLDYLVVDLPPEASDARSLLTRAPVTGAAVVLSDGSVRDSPEGAEALARVFETLRQLDVPVLGVLEMRRMAPAAWDALDREPCDLTRPAGAPFLGSIPLAPVRIEPVVVSDPDGVEAEAYRRVARAVASRALIAGGLGEDAL